MSRYQGSRFLALDGEAVEGRYTLLGDSEGKAVENIDGLSTRECLEFLGRKLPRSASWTRVGFGLHYDVNQWVRDLDQAERLKLFAGDVATFERWQLQYVANRIFTIKSRGDTLATIYDCLGMFRRPFAAVCDEWLGSCPEIISDGKQRRERFSRWDLDFVRAYNRAECDALVLVLDRVRDFLAGLPGGGVRLRGWYGAGAIASQWLRRVGARRLMRRFDLRHVGPDLLDAFGRAYHGGRVEALALGTLENVYRYDLNSAYAWSAHQMGRVTYRWLPAERFAPDRLARMSVWLVRWNLPNGAPVGPFPVRDSDGAITYPRSGYGWYWWPEVRAARDLFGSRRIQVERGYICEDGHKPVGIDARYSPDGVEHSLGSVLHTMYQYRHWCQPNAPQGARLLKLSLAAVWGKFAQRKSANDENEPGFWFCLPWAGYITSMTRARLLWALRGADLSKVVAFSTDGIVTTEQLPDVRTSSNLGGWSVEPYARGTFVLPGLFRLDAFDGTEAVEKTRGFERAQFRWPDLLEQLSQRNTATLHVRRFIGHVLPDLWPEWEQHRCRFVDVAIRVDPAAILRKRVGGAELAHGFDWTRDAAWLGAPAGNPEFLSEPMPAENEEEEMVKRNESDGDLDAAL